MVLKNVVFEIRFLWDVESLFNDGFAFAFGIEHFFKKKIEQSRMSQDCLVMKGTLACKLVQPRSLNRKGIFWTGAGERERNVSTRDSTFNIRIIEKTGTEQDSIEANPRLQQF